MTAIYASSRGWSAVVPAYALAGGVLAAVMIGAIAGLYPAVRAGRLAGTALTRDRSTGLGRTHTPDVLWPRAGDDRGSTAWRRR